MRNIEILQERDGEGNRNYAVSKRRYGRNMDTWFRQLLDRILIEFHIGDRKNIDVKTKMSEGFSEAEVYLIELKGDSAIKGFYYLKIDKNAEEYRNHQKSFCFSKAVKCVAKKRIENYYVMLLRIAGNSVQEYRKFQSIYQSSIKTKAVRSMAGEMLEEATNGREIVGEEICPVILCQKQLQNKLLPGQSLPEFLTRHLQGNTPGDISSIQIGEVLLPNAYAYAVNKTFWVGKRFKDMPCSIHGDLHAGNVLVSNQTSDYAVIDMAYYRNDGWLFFDMAYFEFNLMLHNLKRESLEHWLFCVWQVAEGSWDEVDFKDGKVIRAISGEEKAWIDRKVTERFNYLDQLRQARILARVLAGLNYAGKKDIPEENRFRAYLFACCYLKRLLVAEGIPYISPPLCVWK